MRVVLDSEQQQEAFGQRLSSLLPSTGIVFLEGDLGAGKTTLVRGVLRGMGWVGAVKSPTYTIMEPYEFGARYLYHFDLYRLADPEELEYLGLRDMLDGGLLFFEWPERGAGMLPLPDLHILITHLAEGRELELSANSTIGQQIIDHLA